MPEAISKDFLDACKQAKAATNGEYGPVSIRTILRWFGSARRGQRVVARIKDALQGEGVYTDPDFNEPPIDGECRIRPNPIRQDAIKADGLQQQDQ